MNALKKLLAWFRREEDVYEPREFTGFVRFVPLLVTASFFLCTILLSVYGPMDWHIRNPQKLYPFLYACLAALCLGYLLAVRKKLTPVRASKWSVERIFLFSVAVYLLLYLPIVYVNTGKWYPDVVTGITDSGLAYRSAKVFSEQAPKWVFYLGMLLSPITMLVTPLTLFCDAHIRPKYRLLGVVVILLSIALGISEGVNKQVADTVMLLEVSLCVMLFVNRERSSFLIEKLKIVVAMVLVAGCFLLYYSNTMKNRIQTDIVDSQPVQQQIPVTDERVDQAMEQFATFSVSTPREDSFWYTAVPKPVQPVVTFLTSYFCHGYHGLSLAMDEPFTSTYGLGFSQFLRHNLLKIAGKGELEKDIVSRTYMGKIEKYRWDTGAVWSTFFVFPASDISFPGTVLLVFFIGLWFGASWKDTVCAANPFAAAVFMGFVTMVFYFSANNQMFQTGEACIGFLGNIAAWQLTRREI